MKNLFIGIVAFEHFIFMFVEMFLWTTSIGHKMFNLEPGFAEMTKSLAANQGLYNGFLCAGLVWSLFEANQFLAKKIATFFLFCVIVAGFYGALSVSIKILFIQALPAFVALLLTLSSKQKSNRLA